jgi:uncharacterized Zn finger protein (UPF0148 family)
MSTQSIDCKKCGFVNNAAIVSNTTACPACGAVYSKVAATLEQRERVAAQRARKDQERAAYAAAAEAAIAERQRISQVSHAEKQRLVQLRQSVCLACGSLSAPKKTTQGSGAMETGLWLVGLVTLPFLGLGAIILVIALIYSLWRFCSRRILKCPKCLSDQVIPADTPRGRAELEKAGHCH